MNDIQKKLGARSFSAATKQASSGLRPSNQNISSKRLEVCVSPEKLRLPETQARLWITELVSLSQDARTLYINIGVEKIVFGAGIVHYYLATVHLPDQEVTPLSPLLDIRF